MRRSSLVALLALVLAGPGTAQEVRRLGVPLARATEIGPPPVRITAEAPGPAALSEVDLGERTLLGIAGSAVGLGAGLAIASAYRGCAPESWGCYLLLAGVGGALGSTGGAALGVHGHGWLTDTPVRPGATVLGSVFGLAAGTLVGAGIGVATGSEAGFVLGFTAVQGTLAAMASVR